MELQNLPRVLSFSRTASLRSYGKLEPGNQPPSAYSNNNIYGSGGSGAAQLAEDGLGRRPRSRCVLASVCCVLAVAVTVVLGSVIAVGRARSSHSDASSAPSSSGNDPQLSSGLAAIKAACSSTMFPDFCYQSLSSDPAALSAKPVQLASLGIRLALNHVHDASALASRLQTVSRSSLLKGAARDCVELMEDSKDKLNESISSLDSLSLLSLRSTFEDVKVKLSGAMGYQLACSEGFASQNHTDNGTLLMVAQQDKVSKGVIISLGLVDTLSKLGGDLYSWRKAIPHLPHLRRLRRLLEVAAEEEDEDARQYYRRGSSSYPAWLSGADRKLLQTPATAVAADAVVAQDGSGQFSSIQKAIDSVPIKGRAARYTIYVKKGVYSEYVSIPKTVKNLTLIGDGIGVTIITGSKSNKQQITTYETGTFIVDGDNFIARRITFRNTAGPEGHQAVAARVKSNQAVFDTCGFEGYQDTLYALANRQFYTGCTISGTVDFVFGNAIAVFQNCNIVARVPGPQQQNTLTAQGRKTDSDPSGFSFQKCTLTAEAGLTPASAQSFLGRPWKAYSRTVFLQCTIGGFIDPAGWLPWDGSLYLDTLYYGEYQNAGPGAAIDKRVTWKGYHPSLSPSDASQFTVQQLLDGTSWLPSAQVSFQVDLS